MTLSGTVVLSSSAWMASAVSTMFERPPACAGKPPSPFGWLLKPARWLLDIVRAADGVEREDGPGGGVHRLEAAVRARRREAPEGGRVCGGGVLIALQLGQQIDARRAGDEHPFGLAERDVRHDGARVVLRGVVDVVAYGRRLVTVGLEILEGSLIPDRPSAGPQAFAAGHRRQDAPRGVGHGAEAALVGLPGVQVVEALGDLRGTFVGGGSRRDRE